MTILIIILTIVTTALFVWFILSVTAINIFAKNEKKRKLIAKAYREALHGFEGDIRREATMRGSTDAFLDEMVMDLTDANNKLRELENEETK